MADHPLVVHLTVPNPQEENESRRLAALRRYASLEAPPERAFSDLVALAAQMCSTPAAAVSVVGEEHQWFWSGLGVPFTATPRPLAPCAHAIRQSEIFVVSDTWTDERFMHSPLVTDGPRARFYAGAPLVTPGGHALGTVCVMDHAPRTLAPGQGDALSLLARQVAELLELKHSLADAERHQTDQSRQMREGSREREFVLAVLDHIAEGVVACDDSGVLTLFNRAAREFHRVPGVPLPPAEWAAHFGLYLPDGRTPMRTEDVPLYRAFRGERLRGVEMVAIPADGPARTLVVSGQAVEDAQGGRLGAVVAMQDVTERRQTEARIQEYATALEAQKAELEKAVAELASLATLDGLTGILNHRAFQEHLVEECVRAQRYGGPLSLLLLDVDDFKPYNDLYGHQAGDAVLRTLAGVLRENARETDLTARYGGEEFVILLPQTDAEGALAIAERVRAAVAAVPWSLRPVTVSVGVSTRTVEIADPDLLFACADVALYRSKAAGRNRVTYCDRQDLPK